MEAPTPTSSAKAVSPRSKIPVKSSLTKTTLKVPIKLQQSTPRYTQIAYFNMSDSLKAASRAPSLKSLDITRLPDDLKLIGPENWAPWSSAMMAVAELSGFDVAALEEMPRAVHVSCWHNSEKTAEEVREGKMLGLLIKFNISAHMNDLDTYIYLCGCFKCKLSWQCTDASAAGIPSCTRGQLVYEAFAYRRATVCPKCAHLEMERGYPVLRYNVTWRDIQDQAQFMAESIARRAVRRR
ncbi:hypothetical protein TgHK011_001309 [Trichoderma gracile]|nr:hypothetical protein TgHK011_001309 [Trichoderma gracile]